MGSEYLFVIISFNIDRYISRPIIFKKKYK